jgi:hypothetical protein
LSKSILDCPFYVTESKIGVTEGIEHNLDALPAAPVRLLAPESRGAERLQPDRLPDASDLLLRIHVLRI